MRARTGAVGARAADQGGGGGKETSQFAARACAQRPLPFSTPLASSSSLPASVWHSLLSSSRLLDSLTAPGRTLKPEEAVLEQGKSVYWPYLCLGAHYRRLKRPCCQSPRGRGERNGARRPRTRPRPQAVVPSGRRERAEERPENEKVFKYRASSAGMPCRPSTLSAMPSSTLP